MLLPEEDSYDDSTLQFALFVLTYGYFYIYFYFSEENGEYSHNRKNYKTIYIETVALAHACIDKFVKDLKKYDRNQLLPIYLLVMSNKDAGISRDKTMVLN